MWPDRVIVPSPTLDDDLGLAQRVEDLAIKQFVAQSGIKTLDKAVLPRAARRDLGGLCADCADPILHRLGDELGTVVGPDMPGDTAQDEQVGEHVDDVDRFQSARYPNGQALMGELVDDVEHAEPASIMGALLDEVVRPHVVAVLGPEPNARSVIQPETAAGRARWRTGRTRGGTGGNRNGAPASERGTV